MDFCQSLLADQSDEYAGGTRRLIGACILGKPRVVFPVGTRSRPIWNYVDTIRKMYAERGLLAYPYPAGSNGPVEADRLLEKYGHAWFD